MDTHSFDFFLYGQSGIQGTSCPAHYTVLHDENGMTADEVQRLTYRLCYTYSRCTKSVSLAARARFYLTETGDSDFVLESLHQFMKNCIFFI